MHAGGVFRDASNDVLGCFHFSAGIGFAFEAELLEVILVVEVAHGKGWNFL